MRVPSMVTASLLLLGGAPLLSAQQAPAEPPPQFRSGVEVVNVDVSVLDKQGLPIRGLSASDFTVTVAGEPRRVVTAEYVDAMAAPKEQSAPIDESVVSTNEGGGGGRMFVFIVDQSTLEPGMARHVSTAASGFFSRLTYSDRSALMLLPVGPNVPFTWAHDRVREGLQKVTGLAGPASLWEYGSLSEARDIANRNLIAVRSVAERECRSSIFAGGGGGIAPGGGGAVGGPGGSPSPSPAPSGGGGGTPPGGGDSGGAGSAPTGGSGGSGSAPAPTPRASSPFGGFAADACMRGIQMQAEAAWRDAQMTSLSSVAALRQMLTALGRVRGDKTVILISGGWPMDEREEMSVISTVAAEAAAARATLFTMFVPPAMFSADRRGISNSPARDQYMRSGPLETLAGMTGGGTFRVDVNAETTFERLRRELSGFYRIGVQKEPLDGTAKARRMKVQVTKGGTMVRARDLFDVRTYEDRDWAARLASALDSPVLATGVGLRMTSYVAADPESSSNLKLVLTGEASRMQSGEASFQLLVRDLDGRKIVTTEQPLSETAANGVLPFSTNITVPPGTYIVRFALMDSTGHVGAVERRIDARGTALGPITATGPLLVRVPARATGDPRLALDGVRQDERLALELDLEGDSSRLSNAVVKFEIAAKADGPALVSADAAVSAGSRTGSYLAQAVADMRVLPPGDYMVRAKVRSGNEPLGEMRRPFSVTGAPRLAAEVAGGAGSSGSVGMPASLAARLVGAVPPFAIDQVLAPPVLDAYLTRVKARPDANSPVVRDLLDRADTVEISDLKVSDAEAAQAPIASFLQGLNLLSQNKLDPAANAFRNAMRASPDFSPAMVYLGACYAAAGNDKEAAGAWRTALIREGDAVPLHILLADAFLRQGRGDLALQTLQDARTRWPDNTGVKRRYVMATLQAGKYADGLQAVDELVDTHLEDEPSLALGLLVLYEGIMNNRPVQSVEQDRVRMTRYADAYRAKGGPSLALVETWVSAANRKQ